MTRIKIGRMIWGIVLTLVILISCVIKSEYVVENNAKGVESEAKSFWELENKYNKIHFYCGIEEYATIDDSVELSAATNYVAKDESVLEDVSEAEEEIYVTIEFESDFMLTDEYLAFDETRDELESVEEVREYRSQLNDYSKEYHRELIEDNLYKLSSLKYEEVEVIDYSPFVVLTVDKAELDASSLMSIVEDEEIEHVSLSFAQEPKKNISWNDTLSEISAYQIVSNQEYTGKGIRIGVYESGGVCDITHKNLSDKDITIKNKSSAITSHATIVTSIIATIAPDAEYYVSEVDEKGIAWFIENECDIVNCSFGYFNNTKNADGTYTDGSKTYRYDIDAVYDYQIRSSYTTVVVAAGNYSNDETQANYNPNNRITSPGYAYNAITVGGVKRTWSPFQYVLTHDEKACYVSGSPVTKPNVSAIYTVSVPNIGSVSGTSISAPQVAGAVALLEESNPKYLLYPERVLAVITSTAEETYDYNANRGNFDDEVGAGVIELEKMINNSLPESLFSSRKSGKLQIMSKEITLSKGTDLQVALAWMVSVENSSTNGISISDIYLTDYDLRLYSPSGTLITSSLSDSNVELIRHTAEETGTYKIIVYQYSSQDENNAGDWVALTYTY